MEKKEAMEVLENWEYAGKISGAAYRDETETLAALAVCDEAAEKRGLNKEAVGRLFQKIISSPAARAGALAAVGVGGGTAGGFAIGQKVQADKSQEEIKQVAPRLFRAGFIQGARQGYMRGARAGAAHALGQRVKK